MSVACGVCEGSELFEVAQAFEFLGKDYYDCEEVSGEASGEPEVYISGGKDFLTVTCPISPAQAACKYYDINTKYSTGKNIFSVSIEKY